ncbi:hypothetical protein H2199_004210 [Coniosporium tulheliwenetii]|uniref:Uncharacterized protein n=1 Tax=Coniosporium tulheliwenetii TaxID=3383036 RepID=A0ACC2Z8G8_9PEZI|nr:hypothetical protein H2199_004210 [Cladosporium sp. JES 115]
MSTTATTTTTRTTSTTVTATATVTTADTAVTDTVSVEIITETYTAVETAANTMRKRNVAAQALPTVTQTVLPGAYDIIVEPVNVDIPGEAKVLAASDSMRIDESVVMPLGAEARLDLHRRAEPTPFVVASWHPAMISAACSSINTWTSMATTTTTRPAPTTVATATAVVTATGVAYATVEFVTATAVVTVTETTTATLTVTTTSFVAFTSVSASTTTTTVTRTVEPLVLESPAGIFGDPRQGLARDGDDNYYNLTLPFAIGSYGVTSETIFLSTNGLLSNEPTYEWVNEPLPASGKPSEQYPERAVPSMSIFPFWTDLYMRAGYPHGIFYEILGDIGSRSITFEYYATRYNDEEGYYHFTVAFYENIPGVIDLKYYEMGSNSSAGTVGVQNRDAGKWLQFSHNEPKLYRGVAVRLDTRIGNGAIAESRFIE